MGAPEIVVVVIVDVIVKQIKMINKEIARECFSCDFVLFQCIGISFDCFEALRTEYVF